MNWKEKSKWAGQYASQKAPIRETNKIRCRYMRRPQRGERTGNRKSWKEDWSPSNAAQLLCSRHCPNADDPFTANWWHTQSLLRHIPSYPSPFPQLHRTI